MFLHTKNIITKKTMFYLYFFTSVLSKFIYNCLITFDQIFLYSYYDSFCHLTYFLKYSSISMLNTLVDIVVIDRASFSIQRFELHYVFWNTSFNCRVVVLLYNNGFNPIISLYGLFSSSNWLEREAWDMFGLKFLFHPNLRRILTDYNFKGHPLRKDFPLIGYVELIYNDSIHNIQIVPVEITQNLRFFEFLNPWIKFKNYEEI